MSLGIKGVVIGMVPYTITQNDSSEKNLLPVLMTFCSACLGVLVPEDRMLLPRGTANIPLNWKLRCLPDHLITDSFGSTD